MEVAIIGAVVAGVVGLIAWASKRSARQRQTWQLSADHMGMSFQAGPHSARYIHARRHLPEMYGQYDGQDVYIGVRVYSTGSGKNRTNHYYTYIDVVFDLALKRGLGVRRADGVSKFFGSIFGERDIQIGFPEFDRQFRIDGVDSEQVRRLVSQPTIMKRLEGEYGSFKPSITDTRVRFEASGIIVEDARLKLMLRPAVALYREVLESWHKLPRSVEEKQVAEPWKRVAGKNGLSLEERGMRARGKAGDVHVRLEVVLDEKNTWKTEVEAQFDPPLAIGLAITPQGALAGIKKLFGSQDIEVGDRAFDDEFVIKGKHVERVTEILSDEAREGLLALHNEVHELQVTDSAVVAVVSKVVADADVLDELLSKVVATANAMVQYRKVTPVGPYR